MITIEQVLFRQGHQFARLDKLGAFQGSRGGKGPTGTAGTLILDGSQNAFGTPVDGRMTGAATILAVVFRTFVAILLVVTILVLNFVEWTQSPGTCVRGGTILSCRAAHQVLLGKFFVGQVGKRTVHGLAVGRVAPFVGTIVRVHVLTIFVPNGPTTG